MDLKTAVIEHHRSQRNTLPSKFKHLGPGTAVREIATCAVDTRQADSDDAKSRNLNDICFGCDGSCGDATCSSKRSSRVSADVESNGGTSPCMSPVPGQDRTQQPDTYLDPQGNPDGDKQDGGGDGDKMREADSENMNVEVTGQSESRRKGTDSDNGNSQSESPAKRTPRSSPKCRSPKTTQGQGKKFKRVRSTGEAPEESPNKKGHRRGSTEPTEGDHVSIHLLPILNKSLLLGRN